MRRIIVFIVTALMCASALAEVKVSDYYPLNEEVEGVREFYSPGAAFIKVYFEDVTVPVKVRSPDRKEQRLYSPGEWKQATKRGDSFGALSVHGDTAIVEVLGQGSVKVTGWDVGLPKPQLIGEPESTCGVNDMEPIACYDGPVYERRRPVAKLLIFSKGSSCTAWRVGPGNKMLTNWHCAATQADIASSEVWFEYQYQNCDGTGAPATVKIPAVDILNTYMYYDYTLFTALDGPELQQFGWFGLEPRQADVGDGMYMIGHPFGYPKIGIVNSTENASGFCEIDIASQPGWDGEPNADYGYHCDSAGGQSGSPVIDRSNGRAIGLHHFGGTGPCYNGGVKIANIWPRISSFFDEVPIGDNEVAVERPYVVMSFECTDNVCDYHVLDSRADTFLWDFGDGTTSDLLVGQKVYDLTDVYTVHLYGTLNGITDVVTKQQVVTLPGETIPPTVTFEVFDEDNYVGHFVTSASDWDGEVVNYKWIINDCGDAVRFEGLEYADFRYTFACGGPQKAWVTVVDNDGASSATAFRDFTITGPIMNQPPVLIWDWEQVGDATIRFYSDSYDPDGFIEFYQWYFGDGAYAYAGSEVTHTYNLTSDVQTFSARHYIYDDRGASVFSYKDVTVKAVWQEPPPDPCGNGICDDGETWETCPADCEEPPPPPPPADPIVLDGYAAKDRGPTFFATFTWVGAVGATVELRGPETYRLANDGAETLTLRNKYKGTYWYLCDSTQCSKALYIAF